MRAFLDACVLYPPVMREALLAAARLDLFAPLWSDRVLGEWHHVAKRDGPLNAMQVEGEQALLKAEWPQAMIGDPGDTPDLWLPDPADIHVLAAARAGRADVIVTMNLKDFPRREMLAQDMAAVHPDAFLHRFCEQHPDTMQNALEQVQRKAAALAGAAVDFPKMLKRARLPRLAKFATRSGLSQT